MSGTRYYLYVSDPKVDHCLGQIEEARKTDYAVKFGINFGVEAGVTVTGRDDSNRYQRLAAAEQWIQETKKPRGKTTGAEWIDDSADVSALVFPEDQNVMFFFADSDDLFLGLAGAAHNMMGNVRPSTAYSTVSHLPTLMGRLRGMVDQEARYLDNTKKKVSDYANAGVTPFGNRTAWTEVLFEIPGQLAGDPTQRVSFLARSLASEVVNGKRWTLATPLYVALEDASGWGRH